MMTGLPPIIERQSFDSAKAHFELAITIAAIYMHDNGLKYERDQGLWNTFEGLHKGTNPNILFEVKK